MPTKYDFPEELPHALRLARFGLTTGNSQRLMTFFSRAFGSQAILTERRSGTRFEQLMRVKGGAHCLQLAIGEAIIEVLEFDNPGKPYLPSLSPFDNAFQHFAIVVDDMDTAFKRLSAVSGWSAISSSGPQELPDSSGGVKAFKFRDPDGHPLELLRFPEHKVPEYWRRQSGGTLFLGIDHSAISVSEPVRSISFYRTLGLHVAARTFNHGIEQELLDGIPSPQVDVIALAPINVTPHVELLYYRESASRRAHTSQSNDIDATRLIFEAEAPPLAVEPTHALILDPDGHHLQFTTTRD
jgi:catechol 2,3-dioxygenase-like lactoylglutathione lyase family enzyme